MSTCLITGGAGFIGSHLTAAALARGQRVVVVDDFSTGRRENLEPLAGSPDFEVVEGPAGQHPRLAELVAQADVVYHLAATVGVFNAVRRPAHTIENNVGTTDAVLRAATPGRQRVIVASTSEVYGKSARVPFRETDDLVLGPSQATRWGYAASKLVDEFLALAYVKEVGLEALVVRPFNTIGPGQVGQYGMVVPRLIGQALTGRELTVYGSGRQTRCFTYVSDVVEWLLRLGELPGAAGQVFNLGNPREISIAELAERILAVTGSQSKIRTIDYETAYGPGFEDLGRRVPDISKVVEWTGYAPQVDLDEALRRTAAWLRQHPLPLE